MRDPTRTNPRLPGGSAVEHYGTKAERRKKAAAEAAKKQRDEAAIEIAVAHLERYVRSKRLNEGFDREMARRDNASRHQELLRWTEALTDKEIPPDLKDYMLHLLRSSQKDMGKRSRRGRGKPPFKTRDDCITETVEMIVQLFGLKARRSSDKHESGCSIVHKALARLGKDMTENNVRDIFDKSEQRVAIPFRESIKRYCAYKGVRTFAEACEVVGGPLDESNDAYRAGRDAFRNGQLFSDGPGRR
jgi:hypothetical protein